MNIIGPDKLIFGVDDVAACKQFALDYGLVTKDEQNYVSLDGTGIEILHKDDASLPAPLPSGSMLRKTIYGVADQATVEAIAAELSKDREVKTLADGSIEALDDLGFVLGFQVTIRQTLDLPAETINAPGAAPQRGVNLTGVSKDFTAKPRSLSHVVYFVPDIEKAEAFYSERLGFVTTDRFTGTGPFMRPAGTLDHHTLFFLKTPPFMQGVEHFTFHMSGPTEVSQAGYALVEKGYQSFWGPGRHIFGSNWFWYFKSPFGCNIEYDADMDLHDDSWEAREALPGADNSQVFLLQSREKWAPGGPPGKP
ncbi:MAG: VOC family protein [Paraglaciecola sp.]|uniref:VOC family protein n=1 Tax=Paraglaciecola sp. TaxID=1920173 RepID=UPI00273CFFDF|nr:VOC family protein [Paraglaciecola sp.]MDP5029206.1 VOC family protein [Paraglaciecola sp.]MDP5129341.1 VOC family protein [Paraglaciecola sp.]